MLFLAPAAAMTMNLVCPGGWTVPSNHGAYDAEVRIETNGDQGRLIDVSDKKGKWRPLTKVHLDGGRIEARLPTVLWDHPGIKIELPGGRVFIGDVGGFFYGACHPAASGDPL